jgi:hypothetical protein
MHMGLSAEVREEEMRSLQGLVAKGTQVHSLKVLDERGSAQHLSPPRQQRDQSPPLSTEPAATPIVAGVARSRDEVNCPSCHRWIVQR